MIGKVLEERYEILGEIGRGGMGVVYRARDPLLRREVAVKMIPPSRLDSESEERIRFEARLVARLEHPAIVPILDLGQHEGALYLVMPLVPGDTLRERIARSDLRLGDVLEIGVQAARALAYSHSQGVVHRDVKPSNLMVGEHSGSLRLRIMDFGIARRAGQPKPGKLDQLPGTLAYLSPEQIAAPESPPDGRSDLYSLGVVLYECLTGEPPFSGPVYSTLYRIAHEEPPGLRRAGLEVDAELEALVLSCLAKDPADRPEDGRALARDLDLYRDRMAESQWARPTLPIPSRMAVEGLVGGRADLPLVARREELGRLEQALEAALGGECRWVVVGGEAGIGKSRLLRELEASARRRRIRVLRGQFSDWETSFPYQGLCQLVEDFYRGQETGDEPTDVQDLVRDLFALYPALSEIPDGLLDPATQSVVDLL
ncbi:MAG: serine/threonine-protein kinase, partial [Holophagales bacterium]|nr:serine/threonine-protein kinase [Holophagales bacterium]